jgi:DnaK suppressor protein
MGDVADQAGELVDHYQAAALKHLHEEQERLRRIEQSIAPAQPGDERECRDCGKEIPAERLAVLPRAMRCVKCAELAETHYREQAWRRPT